MGRCSSAERAHNCMTAVDVLWERCQNGVDYVFPPDDGSVSRRTQQRAATLLLKLMRAANRLTQTALAADPAAVSAWTERREAYYRERGWTWPGDPVEVRETRAAITQMAMEL